MIFLGKSFRLVLLCLVVSLQQNFSAHSRKRFRPWQRWVVRQAAARLQSFVSLINKPSSDVKNKIFGGQNCLLFSIYSFFEKIETWFKVSCQTNVMHQKVESLKRSFHVSQLIYKEFSSHFAKLFNCNDAGEEPKLTKTRKKSKWVLMIMINGPYPNDPHSYILVFLELRTLHTPFSRCAGRFLWASRAKCPKKVTI